MELQGHGQQKYLNRACRMSSDPLHWPSILVERRRHDVGRLCDLTPQVTEVAVILSGAGRVRRRNGSAMEDCNGGRGTVWLCPAGVEEREVEVVGGLEDMLHVYIPDTPLGEDVLQTFGADPDKARIAYRGGFYDPMILQIMQSLADELRDPGPMAALAVETLRTMLNVHLITHYSAIGTRRAEVPEAGGLSARRIANVRDYIETHLHEPIRLESLAAVSNLSPFHFARSFKEATGRTPGEFIIDRRIERAKEMLMCEAYDLVGIALDVGFSGQAHFSRCFKQRVGMPPGAFRKSMR
ncbi:AraC family transcriptional regulator (plasmid) [Thioclava sp. 'Guangxiensis']|uniref:AraC family transcriptional regulator n=1 Tax=Thioclava sp. 'Guangxiensis' TaxID=3149044 RepID=UPI0032C41889